MKAVLKFRADLGRDLVTPQGGIMNKVEKTVAKTVEFVLFDVMVPCCCIAVKGVKGLREITSRRKEEHERRQKEASKNKEEK